MPAAGVGTLPVDRTIPIARVGGGPEGMTMLKNFDDLQKLSKDNVDMTLQQLGAVSKGFQAIATEMADYSKKSFEESSALAEKLLGSKSLEKAIEIQSAFVKTAYEGFVAEATKIGELYADLAKETYKPFEGYIAKVSPK
jgi:hypothetical protein